MRGLTSDIEKFLKSLLENTNDNKIEIGRNDLANKFDCSPSQINYVLSTRFTSYRGYHIESRRGGGGFIKIVMLNMNKKSYIEHIISNMGDEITQACSDSLILDIFNKDYITLREFKIIKSALCENALRYVYVKNRNKIRCSILKNMLVNVILGD